MVFVKGGGEEYDDSSSDDDFEIDDSFLDPDHEEDLEEELNVHASNPAGRGKG